MFLLGYPGRTYRHYTASYMAYEEEVRMPYVADWYGWQIDLMEKAGANDPALALKLSSRIKGLANTMKNYRGKLKGMKKLGLVEAKRKEEQGLQQYLDADAKRRAAYGDVLASIDKVYAELRGRAEYEMVLEYLRSSVNIFNFAWTAYEAAVERRKPDLEREGAYMDRNWDQTRQRLQLAQRNYDSSTDKAIFKELLLRALRLKGTERIAAVDELFKADRSEQAVDAYLARVIPLRR